MLATLLLLAGLGLPEMSVASTPPRQAEANMPVICLPRDLLLKTIVERHHAVPMFIGMNGPEKALEVWRDPVQPNDLWIAFVSGADGISCVVGQGQHLGIASPSKPGAEGSPS